MVFEIGCVLLWSFIPLPPICFHLIYSSISKLVYVSSPCYPLMVSARDRAGFWQIGNGFCHNPVHHRNCRYITIRVSASKQKPYQSLFDQLSEFISWRWSLLGLCRKVSPMEAFRWWTERACRPFRWGRHSDFGSWSWRRFCSCILYFHIYGVQTLAIHRLLDISLRFRSRLYATCLILVDQQGCYWVSNRGVNTPTYGILGSFLSSQLLFVPHTELYNIHHGD